jgi:DNA-binding winged helix-turn-helix (wHTH) protein
MGPHDNNDRPDSGGNNLPSVPRILQFGSFELRTDTGELRKHGIRVRLQMKPLQILLALLEQPGEVVRRDQLQHRLWPADIFVDFESGLNTAANRLRIALGDSADIPRFVETLPRIGYRFVAPVREIPINGSHNAVAVAPVPNGAAPVNAVVPEPVAVEPAPPPAVFPAEHDKRRRLLAGIASGVAIMSAIVFLVVHFTTVVHGQHGAEFHEVPLTRGNIASARFGPDGETLLYTISSDSGWQTYLGSALNPESTSIGIRDVSIVSVSRKGELALIRSRPEGLIDGPTLLRAPLNGGMAQEAARSIYTADWAPDGNTMAVVRDVRGRFTIEYPLGATIYTPARWASDLRVSPDGTRLAFIEHPLITDDAGQVRVIDRQGKSLVLSQPWASAQGLAWAPSGKEVWFTASKSGSQRALYSISLTSVTRLVGNVPGALRLLDISRTGRVLISRDDERMLMAGKLSADRGPEDLSWYDYSHVDAISSDGNLLLFTESGEAGGAHYSMFIHDRSANKTTRIGGAEGLSISPDRKWVLAMDVKNPGSLSLQAIGSGDQKTISGAGLRYQWATFFPDGQRLLAGGAYPGQPLHLYTQRLDGGPPVPLNTSTYLDFAVISPDSKKVAGYALGRRLVTLSLDTFATQDIPGTTGLLPVSWSPDGRTLLLSTISGPVLKLSRVDPVTGSTELADSFNLPDPGNGVRTAAIVATPSGKSWACSYTRTVSQLYVVDGWG